MPKYTFKCTHCEWKGQKFTSVKNEVIDCPLCDNLADRVLPVSTGAADVNEVIDKYTGITFKKDQQELTKQRSDEYYWSQEVPRLVQSGTYSIQTMLENGWIYVDDKNQIHIHTKPPGKR